ncbi:hypothetical protein FS749_005432 [Ceratobasidium sp. UAMH 11750]|nr:hypothetical protein FS749_005432 [Ceratobasidium sp. UAMH 11750]
MIKVIDLQQKFFSHPMDDSTKIEDHVCLMCSWYEGLWQINNQNVKPFDWVIQLPVSLLSSWDVFIQSIQHDLQDLSDATKHNEVMKTITSKVMAEGQRCEKKEGKSAMFAVVSSGDTPYDVLPFSN